MIVAVDVDDVLDDLLAQGTVGDLEQVGDRQPREHRGLGPQEELAGLAVEHDVAERAGREPAVVAFELRHRGAVAVAAQLGVGVVEARKFELGGKRHRGRG